MAGDCLHAGGVYTRIHTRLHSYFASNRFLFNSASNKYRKYQPLQPILYAIKRHEISHHTFNTKLNATEFNHQYRLVQHKYTYPDLSDLAADLNQIQFKYYHTLLLSELDTFIPNFTIHLIELKLSLNDISEGAIKNISTSCTNLQVLHLSLPDEEVYYDYRLDFNTGNNLQIKRNQCVKAIAQFCTRLRILSLHYWRITSECLPSLSTFTHLTTLDLTGCLYLSSGDIQTATTHIHSIQKLILSKISINDMLFHYIGDHCPDLGLLYIDGVVNQPTTTQPIEYMIQRCPLLIKLHLSIYIQHIDNLLFTINI